MHRVALALAALGLSVAQRVAAQDLPWLTPGQRVRVTAPDAGMARTVARLVAFTPESLVVARVPSGHPRADSLADARRTAIPLGSVTALDAGAGRRGHTVLGIVIGGAVAGAAGAAYGYSQGNNDPAANFLCDYIFPCGPRTAAGKAAWYGALGALYGGVLGGIVGSLVRTERWVPVPLDRVRVSLVAADRGRLGVAATLSF